jgi:hypothetical protein
MVTMHFGNLILAQVCCRYIRMTFLPFKAQHPLLSCLNQHVPANPSGQGQLGLRHLAKSCHLPWLWKLVHLPFWMVMPLMPLARLACITSPKHFECVAILGSHQPHHSFGLSISVGLAGLSMGHFIPSCLCSPWVVTGLKSVSTGNALCSHHQSIASALSVGSFVHLALFNLREGSKQVLAFKASPASHLSWVTLWLGFHLLDTCVHSDAVNAFGTADTALLIQPNLANTWSCVG